MNSTDTIHHSLAADTTALGGDESQSTEWRLVCYLARMRDRPAGLLLLLLALSSGPLLGLEPGPTVSVRGPLRAEGARIIDASGESLILRGTQMFALDPDSDRGEPHGIAGLTPTTFSTIRQRWNMNVLRILVSVRRWEQDPDYLPWIDRIVRQANEADLAVTLAAFEDGDGLPTERSVRFWETWAAHFSPNDRMIFDLFHSPQPASIEGHAAGIHSQADWKVWRDGGVSTTGVPTVGMQDLANAVRSTGAPQLIIAMGLNTPPFFEGFDKSARLADDNVAYQICPLHRAAADDAERDRQFGFLAESFPLIANNWDLRLGEASPECEFLRDDPAFAAELVRSTLRYFEERRISWTVSLFEPGFLIEDFVTFERTKLTPWTCGEPGSPPAGMGEEIRVHMWSNGLNDVTLVNGASGSTLIPRGGLAIAYHPNMADSAEAAQPGTSPTALAGSSVVITDSAGVRRFAELMFVSPIQINMLIDEATAVGPASIEVLHPNGLKPSGKLFVGDNAPGLFTATANARGAAIAFAVNHSADGSNPLIPLWECSETACATLPLMLPQAGNTELMLLGSGLRGGHARVTINGSEVPVLQLEPLLGVAGVDCVIVGIGRELAGMGEADLLLTIGEQVANAVRIRVE